MANGERETRLILNIRGSPIYKLSCLIYDVLSKFKSELRFADQGINSVIKFVDEMQDNKDINNYKMVKVDIKALYPSISPKVAISKLISFIDNSEKASQFLNDYKFPRELLVETLDFTLNNNYVKIGKRYFKQSKGLPIGSLLSGLISEFYLQDIQKELDKILEKTKSYYTRYVDDFLLFVPKNVDTSALINEMNSFDKDIKFNIEEEGDDVNYLQMNLKMCEKLIIRRWYRKEQTGDRFLDFWSNVPFVFKISNINRTINDLRSINNTPNGFELDCKLLKRIL